MSSANSCASVSPNTSFLSTLQEKVLSANAHICEGIDWLGRRYVFVTDKACGGHQRIAAIARIILNTAASFGLTLACYSVIPLNPILTLLALSLAESVYSHLYNRPVYLSTGMNLHTLLQEVTISSPLVRLFIKNRFSPFSIAANSLCALLTGILIINKCYTHYQDELPSDVRKDQVQ